MRKRFLAALIALVMVIGLVPGTALAAGDGDTVNRIRLMSKDTWELAAIERVGYSNDDVLWSTITDVRFSTDDGAYTNWGVIPEEAPDCYSHEGYLATDAGTKIVPSDIDRIVVTLNFAYEGWEALDPEYNVTAVFHKEDFTLAYSEGVAGVREYAELTLINQNVPENQIPVTFMFQPIGSVTWELYDIVYVNSGGQIGNRMPPDPDYVKQDFVS